MNSMPCTPVRNSRSSELLANRYAWLFLRPVSLRWLRASAAVGACCLAAVSGWGGVINASWDNVDGNWDVAANWTPDGVPNNGADTFNVTINRTGRTVTLPTSATDITIEALTLTAGTLVLQSPRTLTANDLFTWNGGTLSGAGTVNALNGLNLATSTTRTLNGVTLNLLGAGTASTWTAGSVTSSSNATLKNEGTFSLSADSYSMDSQITVNNPGTLQKTSGTGTATFNGQVNNSGAVAVNTGTLALYGGGTGSGTFSVASGATLDLRGTHDLQVSSSLTGAGTAKVSSGTTTFSGTYNVTGNTAVTGGTANFNSAVTSVGALTVSGGTANFSTGGSLAPLSVGLSSGTLTGSDGLNVSGLMTWTGGTLSGSGIVNANGGLVLSGVGSRTFNGKTLHLPLGQVGNWDGGTVSSSVAAIFNNAGLFDLKGSGYSWDSQITVNNAGTLQQNSGVNTTTFNGQVNNSGAVAVNTGTLALYGGGTGSGTFSVASGATLDFRGTHSLGAGSSVAGGGSVVVSSGATGFGGDYDVTGNTTLGSGTADFTGAVNHVGVLTMGGGTGNFSSGDLIQPASMSMTGGTLTGTDTITLASNFPWSGGTINGSLTVNANNGVTWASGSVYLSGATLNLGAGSTLNWTGSYPYLAGGGVLNNHGVVDLASDRDFNAGAGGGTINNLSGATFKKSDGTSTSYIYPAFNNQSGGLVQVEAGKLYLAGGGTSAGLFKPLSGTELRFHSGTHVFETGVELALGGTHVLDNATITVNGAATVNGLFTMMSGSTLNGPGTLTVNNTMDWTGGTMGGTGITRISAGTTLNLTGSSRWLDNRTLHNQGTAQWSGANNLYLLNGAQFQNDGLFQIDTAYNVTYTSGATPTFYNNAGATVRKVDNTTTTFSAVSFDNRSTVETQAGILEFTGAKLTLRTGSNFTKGGDANTGVARFSSGELALAGTVTSDNLRMSGGTLTGTGTFAGPRFEWTGGTMGGLASDTTTIGPAAVMDVTGSTKYVDTRTLENRGTINWSGADHFYLQNGAQIENDGQFNIQTAYDLYHTVGATPTFYNNATGSLRKTDNTTTSITSVNLDNRGVVEALQGTLRFNGGGGAVLTARTGSNFTHGGGSGVTVVAGGELVLAGSVASDNLELTTGAKLTGIGTLAGPSFDWTGGTVGATATDVITLGPSATMNIKGSSKYVDYGTLRNQGDVIWSGANNLYLQNGASLDNQGIFAIQTSYNMSHTGGAAPVINNSGTFRKSDATDTTIGAGISFNNSGTLEVLHGRLLLGNYTQTAGTTRVANNSVLDTTSPGVPITINGGTLTGQGTVHANVILAGDLAPGLSPGRLDITGNLTLSPGSSMTFEIWGDGQGTTYDFLDVSGTMNLGTDYGQLRLSLLQSYLAGAVGKTFTVAQAATITGKFSNLPLTGGRLWTIEHNGTFLAEYLGNTIVLSDWQPVPEPAAGAILAGSGLLGFALCRRVRRPAH